MSWQHNLKGRRSAQVELAASQQPQDDPGHSGNGPAGLPSLTNFVRNTHTTHTHTHTHTHTAAAAAAAAQQAHNDKAHKAHGSWMVEVGTKLRLFRTLGSRAFHTLTQFLSNTSRFDPTAQRLPNTPPHVASERRGDFHVARLSVTRFRAYSQGPHVSMCSPRAVSYNLIRAVPVALRARARHGSKWSILVFCTSSP